jgi:hypothetical protein
MYKVVQTNVKGEGGDAIIIRVSNNEDGIKLNRNTPLYAASSNVGTTYQKQAQYEKDIVLDRNLPVYSASSGVTPIYQKNHEIVTPISLESKLQTSAMTNVSDRSKTVSNFANEYSYEQQSKAKAKGMGSVGSRVDTASGVPNQKNTDVLLPNFDNVQKLAGFTSRR